MTELPAAAPQEYAVRLAADLGAQLGGGLFGAYLHGSAVLGGWTASRSDVDVLFVVADGLAEYQVQAAGDALLAAAARAPGQGLECSVVAARAAAAPGPPWPFVLHLGLRDGQPGLVAGQGHPGDRDLLMHYVVARAAGVAVYGPPPAALVGPVERSAVLVYLADELEWGLAHAPECYCVLNACRAQAYLRNGAIVSKLAGGRMALARGTAPAALVRRALGQQRGLVPAAPPGQDAIRFARATSSALHAAAPAAAAAVAARRATPPA